MITAFCIMFKTSCLTKVMKICYLLGGDCFPFSFRPTIYPKLIFV